MLTHSQCAVDIDERHGVLARAVDAEVFGFEAERDDQIVVGKRLRSRLKEHLFLFRVDACHRILLELDGGSH